MILPLLSLNVGRTSDLNQQYHYPPELFNLLVEAIPRLVKSKRDVLVFFRGAGVKNSITTSIESQLKRDRDSINKFDIVRGVLGQLNEIGDSALRERREILKRVVEFEDFSTCWENDRLAAQGLVAQIQSVVNVKDSFTRMNQEREAELRRHKEARDKELQEMRLHRQALDDIGRELNKLFALSDPHKRGKLLEGVLNRLFKEEGVLVKEGFIRIDEPGEGVVEQIDGAIELEGDVYIVEMKWLKDPVGTGDVAQHLVRVFNRGGSRGIFISYSEYTPAAILTCKESLSHAVIVLCKLEELVLLSERGDSLKEFLKAKIRGSIIDKQPFTKVF